MGVYARVRGLWKRTPRAQAATTRGLEITAASASLCTFLSCSRTTHTRSDIQSALSRNITHPSALLRAPVASCNRTWSTRALPRTSRPQRTLKLEQLASQTLPNVSSFYLVPKAHFNRFVIALAAKYDTAQELKEMIDTVRDVDAPRLFPHMLSTLLDIIRNSEPSLKRDTIECNFRKVLVEIIHHIPPAELIRTQSSNLIDVLLNVIRNDNEDNGVICMKILNDTIRASKQVSMTDEQLIEISQIFLQLLKNIPGVVNEFFSDSSQTLDPGIILPSIRSLKVLAEMSMVMIWLMSQPPNKQTFTPFAKDMIGAVLDVSTSICLSLTTTN